MQPDEPGGEPYPSSSPPNFSRGDGRLPARDRHWPAAGQREWFPLPYATCPMRKSSSSRSSEQRRGII